MSTRSAAFLAQVAKLCVGLEYPSGGADHEVEPFELAYSGATAPTANELLVALGYNWDPVAIEPGANAFTHLSAVEDWWTPNQRARGRRFRALEDALRPLANLTAYTVGQYVSEEPLDVIVIGRLESGEWVGVTFVGVCI